MDLNHLEAYSDIKVPTLRDHIRYEGLPCFKVKGKLLVKRSEFDAWMEKHRIDGLAKVKEMAADVMARLDESVQEAVVINYKLMQKWLTDLYPLIFGREDTKSMKDEDHSDPQAKNKNKIQRDPMGWVKVYDALVGDDIVNQERYAGLPLHSVLRYITKQIKENMKSRGKKYN